VGQTPDELKRDIESTREHLGDTLGAIEDRVSPRAIMERRRSAMADGLRSVREAVMGRTDDLTSSASDAAQGVAASATSTVRDAPHMMAQQTQGNPWAAGVIAFGAGLLAAQLLPATRVEQEQASRVLEEAKPLADEAKQAASDIGSDLCQEGRERVEALKGDVADAASAVRDTARSATEETRDAGRVAAQDVRQADPQGTPTT
jgi:Protein of unknown function (DUF3618)